MYRLIFLALVLTKADDLLGVTYSFDVDFYSHFYSHKCNECCMWRLVNYRSLDVTPLSTDSDKAIQNVGESCSSSFPIIFVGGSLEINVYSQVISNFFYLIIEVFDEDDVCVTSYVYRRSSQSFRPGWQTVSLDIYKHFKGYIRLRGKSLTNEILLIDSFRYTPNNAYDEKRTKRSLTEKEDDEEIIFNYQLRETLYDNEIESSGDGDNETTTENPGELPQKRDTIWNPFTISLVSFGVILTVTLCAVGAYHIGKLRGMVDGLTPFVNEEPPRTITIPRVGSRRNPISSGRAYDF